MKEILRIVIPILGRVLFWLIALALLIAASAMVLPFLFCHILTRC